MKNVCAVLALGLTACSFMGMGLEKDVLVKTVSHEHDCPEEAVTITKSEDDGMHGWYTVTCTKDGKEYKYRREGKLYLDANSPAMSPGALGK